MPEYLHGNPYQGRRVVLSKELLDSGELTPVTVVKNTEIIDSFLDKVRAESLRATREQCPLLILLFCHGLENYNFLLDHADTKYGLNTTRIKEAIEPGCRVTLLSTACFGGGWLVKNMLQDSPLNVTALSAADEGTTSNSWQLSGSLSRACGSVFATTVIEKLTGTSCPFLENPDDDDSTSETRPLQPTDPDSRQVETYNAYCQSILDVCKDKVHRLWQKQTFTFKAQDDTWGYSWTARTSIPLAYFEKRWKALKMVPYIGSSQAKLDMDPHPGNPTFSGSAGPSQSGGAQMIDEMTLHISQHRVREMARLFLQTCPGDWNRGWGPAVHGQVSFALTEDDLPQEELHEISSLIRFRWEQGLLADEMVRIFNLPQPDGQICMLCDVNAWRSRAHPEIPNFDKLYEIAWFTLVRGEFRPVPMSELQGPPFIRITEYMTAALVEANVSEEETKALAEGLLEFMGRVKQFHRDRAVHDSDVIGRGRTWIKAIGKKVRRSLSRGSGRESDDEPVEGLGMESLTLEMIPELRPSTPGPCTTAS